MKPMDKTLAAWLVELCHDRRQHKQVDGLVKAAKHIISTAGNPYFLHDDWQECDATPFTPGQTN